MFCPLWSSVSHQPAAPVRAPDGLLVEDDIVYDSESDRNADPCTSDNCKWDKASDGLVYVPYVIATDHYSECQITAPRSSIHIFTSLP